MQAVQGFYDNGVFELQQEAPVKRGKFIMIFTEDELPKEKIMSKEESLRIFREHSNGVSRHIDVEKERDEYLYEKYGPFN